MSQTALSFTRFLFLFLFFTASVKAQKEAKDFNVDSTLYAYYQRCQECLLQPVVLSMSDTLYRMAEERHDKRMQAVAISTQLDYHYFQATNEDSIIYYTNKVKDFAKATQQPKYYYFAWSNRLILYYLKNGRTNIALYEAQKMLKEAQEEDDKTGLSRCYNIMSQIYTVKRLDSMAFEWQLKEIELTEKYDLENYNISQTYSQISSYYINTNQPEKALEALKKADATAYSPTQKISVQLEYVNYYSKFGDMQAAEKILNECKTAFDQDKRLWSIKKRLYNIEYVYYLQSKQYPKALEAAKKQEAEDSLKIANEQMASSEFATLLEVEKLNAEKKELMLQAQEKEIRNKTTLIISLIVLLGILFMFLYRENFLKRKLKVSESELKIRNEELTISREELHKAKDIAEASSRMKTTFIESMTHEIRTPLNSIVGFSQILNDHYSNSPETQEFVKIIENNSNDLLRLVTDVLALSELDQYDKLPTNITTDVNAICELAYEVAKNKSQKGVEVFFKPERESLFILSNQERISQVLNNLMHNAAKFTSHGSICIAYSISEAEKKIEISVTDTGMGIPADKQNCVFERFYKVNSFTQGTGLGLSISRSIAEKLGGSLQIDSSYTDGCRIVLTLPLVYA